MTHDRRGRARPRILLEKPMAPTEAGFATIAQAVEHAVVAASLASPIVWAAEQARHTGTVVSLG